MAVRHVKRLFLASLAALILALPVSAAAAGPVEIRHVDLSKYPLVRVTAVVPKGTRPVLIEGGTRAAFAKTRELGSAEAMVLAVDNSESMQGRPLREAKGAATEFLTHEQRAGTVGLVAFGHEALPLTRMAGGAKSDVAGALAGLAPDTQTGTSLYDAVGLSVSRLTRMSSRTRILVVLTDGRDHGSSSSLSQAIAAAQQANVIIFAIAAGSRADRKPLEALTAATGGRVFKATDPSSLGATYKAVGRELARSWQISYLTTARPGDRTTLTLRAGRMASSTSLDIGRNDSKGINASIPSSLAHSPITAGVVVMLVALLLAAAGFAGNRRRRTSEISRLLESHVGSRDRTDGKSKKARRFEELLDWTERSLQELPGSARLARTVERSGLKLRVGHVPYLAGSAAFFFGIVAAIMGAAPVVSLLLMLVGFTSPFLAFQIAGRRRRKAFDKQLPDILATIASTLRAGHGLRMSLRAVADDGSPPASEEFTRVLGEERLGRPLDQAISGMCERIGSPDLDYVATAINVQSQAGGSLATLFDTLSETVRERQRHARKVRALTSMGRMSATVLICLPIGLAGLMTLISPAYMSPFFTKSAGHVLIGLCLGSMAMGGLFLKKIVNVRY
jgi:tight adherence protein B